MIDSDTRDRVSAVLHRALKDGINPVEALDRNGLLVTDAQIRRQWANCLERLAMNLHAQPVVVLTSMGGGQNTPLDAVRGVLEYIEIFGKAFADKQRTDQ